MVVDDHRQARESMADALRSAGHGVVCCASAPEALQVLDRECFDCILTDLKMPGMNGVEFIIQLETGGGWAVQVVMVTAHASVGHRGRGHAHGAFDYIEKPFNVDQLETACRPGYQPRPVGETRNPRPNPGNFTPSSR